MRSISTVLPEASFTFSLFNAAKEDFAFSKENSWLKHHIYLFSNLEALKLKISTNC